MEWAVLAVSIIIILVAFLLLPGVFFLWILGQNGRISFFRKIPTLLGSILAGLIAAYMTAEKESVNQLFPMVFSLNPDSMLGGIANLILRISMLCLLVILVGGFLVIIEDAFKRLQKNHASLKNTPPSKKKPQRGILVKYPKHLLFLKNLFLK